MIVRLFREARGFSIVVGPWVARVSWGLGLFVNGRRYFSGWHHSVPKAPIRRTTEDELGDDSDWLDS